MANLRSALDNAPFNTRFNSKTECQFAPPGKKYAELLTSRDSFELSQAFFFKMPTRKSQKLNWQTKV